MMGSAGAIIRPLSIFIFLISGFVFGIWSVYWIVFPVTAILLSVIHSIRHAAKEK
ncbi:hypothetical protein [Paenibacillus sonchi]|uniref:hypothetical protein n=1 Tax=Paenibacillus sonchi TaxID=373687 RepID=UPI0002DB04AF|nr:hypothetical protein [Paenibacillus sonchi]